MNNGKIRGLLALFRPELSTAAGICVLLAEILALGGIPPLNPALTGFLSFFCISATALILNDCYDIESDRINSPMRPLVSGTVSRSEAVVLSAAVALLGFISSMAAGLPAFILVLVVWLAGFFYNWKLKKSGLAGNLLVSFSVGMAFIFGGVVVGNPFEKTVWYFAFTTMLVDLGEEIAADALDVEGDRQSGSRSIAVIFGPVAAMRIASALFAIVIIGSFVPFAFGWFGWPFHVPVFLFDILLLLSARNLLDENRKNRQSDIRHIYLGGTAMLVSFIIIRLCS
ncbi:MAG: UbiA family prenyltransferase [Chlorobiaceae bacterium]|nr:UbiA family prenyltransferase [Chlorobiaceae bacterium]